MDSQQILWSQGAWSHPPVSSQETEGALVVEAHNQSDAWRETSSGFTRDSEHALLVDLAVEEAIEVVVGSSLWGNDRGAALFSLVVHCVQRTSTKSIGRNEPILLLISPAVRALF